MIIIIITTTIINIIVIIIIIIIILTIINKTMYHKTWVKKTIMFQFHISIFTSFRRSPPPLSSTH